MKPRVFVIPLLLAAFSVVVIILALNLDKSPPMIVGKSMQPRAFPIFLMVLNLILTALLFLQFLRNPPDPVKLEPYVTWGSILLMGLFYLVATYVDLFIALAIIIFLMCLLWGERRWWVLLATSILTPGLLFLLFDTVLQIRFPRGLFTNWWYS